MLSTNPSARNGTRATGNVADALLHFAADIELGAARAKAAATEIVALINTRPQSPRLDEIEAIIARVVPGRAVLDAEAMSALSEWDAEVSSHLLDCKGTDEQIERNGAAYIARCEAIWAKPVQSMADVLVRLAMALNWNSPLSDDEAPTRLHPR